MENNKVKERLDKILEIKKRIGELIGDEEAILPFEDYVSIIDEAVNTKKYIIAPIPSNTKLGHTSGFGCYKEGSEINVTAFPNENVQFLGWNDGCMDMSRIIKVERDTLIVANFAKLCDVNVYSENDEMGSAFGGGKILEGNYAFISALPNSEKGYMFKRWGDGDINQDRAVVINSDCSYMAEFEKKMPYEYMERVSDFLYRTEYTKLDYEKAKEYFDKLKNNIGMRFACSSMRNGRWYGRNLDWTYDWEVEFVVSTPKTISRNAVLGVSGGMKELTKQKVESGEYADIYNIIPFYLQDGINDKGVFCNINVVPIEKGNNLESIPDEEKYDSIPNLMIPRYVLDNFDTAKEACEYLRKHVSIYQLAFLQGAHYEIHAMIGDANDTFVLEIVNKKIVYHEANIMTNFHIDGTTFNEDGKVYTQYDVSQNPENLPTVKNGITPTGSGLERYNILRSHFDTATSKEGMRAAMSDATYTKSYTLTGNDRWFSEFVVQNGEYNITVDTPSTDDDLNYLMNKYAKYHKHRSRNDALLWQTTHSSVYDLEKKELYIISQEDETDEHKYTL